MWPKAGPSNVTCALKYRPGDGRAAADPQPGKVLAYTGIAGRIAELRDDKQAATAALDQIDPIDQEIEADELNDLLARIPDLTQALREAPVEIKRQTFEAFGLRIEFDKAQRRVEVSATVSEAVAQAFENTKALQKEGSRSPLAT